MRNGTPLALLQTLATVLAAAGCGESTAETGTPAAWVGHTYLATPADPYTFLTSPSNSLAAKQMAGFIPNFLLEVTSFSAGVLAITLAPAKKQSDPPEQDLCNITVNAVASVPSYPKVQIGPMDLPLYITNPPTGEGAITAFVTVSGFSLTDVFPDRDRVSESARFGALVDAREVAPLIKLMEGATPEEVCAAMTQSFATECVPCPDGRVLCLRLEAAGFGAEQANAEIIPLAQSDLDSSCPRP